MANAQIRQEINLIDTLYTTTSASTQNANEHVQVDTTQYNGTVTYYLEAVIKSSSNGTNYTLTFDTASITQADQAITTSYAIVRKAFTPTSGATDDNFTYASNGSATLSVIAARIIIIQNAATLTNTETQIEIGNASNTTTTTDTALTNPKYWQYTSANWDGTITAYFEGTFQTGTSKSAATMTLQTSTSITAPSWSNVASSAVTTTSTTPARVRSGAITLVDGNWYQAVMKAGNSKSGITVYNAKIIIDQLGTTGGTTYYFDGSDAAVTDPNAVWNLDSNVTDGTDSTSANTANSGSVSSNYIMAEGTNAPSSGDSINYVVARIYASANTNNCQVNIYTDGLGELLGALNSGTSSGFGSYVKLSTPSGGWTWAKIQALEFKGFKTTGAGSTSLGQVEVSVNPTETITKLEPQYLLANTLFAAGTGLQTFLTKWDSTEWDDTQGGQPTFYFQAEAADGSTSDVTLEQADGGGTVTNSTVTNIDNAQISSAMTMPGNENLDTKATTNAGDVAAARILVQYVVNSAPPAPTVDPYNGNQFFQLLGVGT